MFGNSMLSIDTQRYCGLGRLHKKSCSVIVLLDRSSGSDNRHRMNGYLDVFTGRMSIFDYTGHDDDISGFISNGPASFAKKVQMCAVHQSLGHLR